MGQVELDTLRSTTLHTTLHYTTLLHYTTPRCHYTTPHYTTLQEQREQQATEKAQQEELAKLEQQVSVVCSVVASWSLVVSDMEIQWELWCSVV